MGGNALLALGFLLLWIGGVAMFTAFHPGGVMVEGKPAKNPADILRYLIMDAEGVSNNASSDQGSQSSTETT